MTLAPHRLTGLVFAVVAGAALLTALGSEWWGGLVPCALCLLERDPYRGVIGLGIIAALLPGFVVRPIFALIALVMLGGVILGATHVGVEQGWWPSPLPECAAPHFSGGSIAERLAQMPAQPSKPCDSPTYLIPFLPVSMAAMNMVLALVMMLAALRVALRPAAFERTPA